uniref:Uncharacterized protein n=1 Tax=Panagrolaimus superbus TaxID=310955 RepID=A0A914YM81_9BILA
MQIVETPESLPKKCNSIIRPIKTTSSKYNLDSIDECFREYISFSLSKSNPYSSAQPASTSTIKSQTKSIKSSSSRGYSESPINGEKTIKMTSSKPQPTKRKVESNFIDNIKKSKTEKSNYSVSSSFVSSKATPNQFVSSLSIDCKKPQKGSPASSSEVKPRQKPSPQRSSLTPAFSNSSLVKKRYKNYISSSLPKSKPYYSPQPASASTIKNRTKSIQLSSSRGYSESPRPISGGKTIRMTPLRPQQRCTSFKTRSPANGFPRCELLTDNGIKMIIRFPKKV